MFGLGTKEIIIIAIILIVLFGIKRIPALSKGIAEALRDLRGIFKSDSKK